MKVLIPFWFVELFGLIVTGQFDISMFLKDMLLIEPATAYGWYIGYIVVCYIIFYFAKKWIVSRSSVVILVTFCFMFVIDSLFFANPEMPFLRARQMLCFPLGIWVADNKESVVEKLPTKISVLLITGGSITGIIFMVITQLQMVKSLPYIASNTLSLFTVLPLAIAVVVMSRSCSQLFNNSLLLSAGEISYEIYLVHAYTLNLVEESIGKILLFMAITIFLALALHYVLKKGLVKKNG